MKKLLSIGTVVFAVAMAGVCGCASKPPQSQSSQVTAAQPPPPEPPPKPKGPLESRLSVGMTMDEVRAACGNPKNESMNSDGSAVWDYNDSEKAMIPNYMLFGGTIHFVRIYFNPGGTVARWSSWSHSRY